MEDRLVFAKQGVWIVRLGLGTNFIFIIYELDKQQGPTI